MKRSLPRPVGHPRCQGRRRIQRVWQRRDRLDPRSDISSGMRASVGSTDAPTKSTRSSICSVRLSPSAR